MNIEKSFTFIFEDPEWLTKILVGSLIFLLSILLSPLLIGLLGFAVIYGYSLEVVKNVRQGRERPLPEWRDQWGEWMLQGLKLAVALLVWSLPFFVLGGLLTIGGAMTDNSDTIVQTIGAILLACFGCIALIWIVIMTLAMPAIYIRLAETGKLGSALQFGRILSFTRDHIGEVIIVTILYLVVEFVVGMVGSVLGVILCLVGLIITLPAASLITLLIQSHLYAQVSLSAASHSQAQSAIEA